MTTATDTATAPSPARVAGTNGARATPSSSRPTALFVSPHLDDVAFSCGGTVARLATLGWRCVVATVFTRSVPRPTGFALACQLDKGLEADVDYLALRRDEDRAFAAAVGAETAWFDLPEAPHRGYGSAAALFGPTHDEDGIGAAVDARLAAAVDRMQPVQVFAPLALGDHVDHVQVARAVRRSLRDVPVAWYRDTPYALRLGSAAADGATLAVALDGASLDAKLAGCAAYATQIGFQFGGVDAMRAALVAHAQGEARAAGHGDGHAERFAGRWGDACRQVALCSGGEETGAGPQRPSTPCDPGR